MILNTDNPEVIHSGTPVRRIDMSEMGREEIEFMLKNSRDDFYSNKELAPIREYSTNARDAHIVAGIPEVPIHITLPSQLAPELKIRDFGKGLSEDELADIYFKYWKSTKRGSNLENGCLGIGAKSALAYAPVYTVTSWNNGRKIVSTGQKNGFADIICNIPNIAGEPEGIEITIPIENKDINKFILEALNFFKFWDIRPVFHNIEADKLTEAFNLMDVKPFISGDGWAIRPAGYGKGDTKAVMSFVPYSIDWEQVRNSMPPEISNKIGGIYEFLEENLTTLNFPNGSLSFTPNRESLQYNEQTIKTIGNALVKIYDSLLNLITEKISDAPDIWEAKIRYNRIFRKELDGFEKSEVFAGNLSTIERFLRSRIYWNGITINNGNFENLNSWDANEGCVGNDHDNGFIPILTTYVKNEDRIGVKAVKTNRRNRWSTVNDKIICSPKSVVIIQDTKKNSWAKGAARYFLYKSVNPASQVYVINLSNPDIKKDFYSKYNFETVPVFYISQNEKFIKTYLRSVRAPRSDSGIKRGESRPMNCLSIDIKNRQPLGSVYPSKPYWNTESTNARGVEGEGMYYVVYNKDFITVNNKNIYHTESEYFWQSVYELSVKADVPLDKVYGIYPKSADSVWFKEAVEEGSWINLSEYIEENIDALPKDDIKKINAYFEADMNRIGFSSAETLIPLLTVKDGVASKYFNEIVSLKDLMNVKDIPGRLKLDGFDGDESEIEKFVKANEEMMKTYPLLFKTNQHCIIGSMGLHTKLEKDFASELAEYINLKDGQLASGWSPLDI